jgi:hypothetical protein
MSDSNNLQGLYNARHARHARILRDLQQRSLSPAPAWDAGVDPITGFRRVKRLGRESVAIGRSITTGAIGIGQAVVAHGRFVDATPRVVAVEVQPAIEEISYGIKTLFATKTATHYRFWIGGDRPQVQLVWEKAIAEIPPLATRLSLFLDNTGRAKHQWKAGVIWRKITAAINPTQCKYWEFSADGAAEFEIAPTWQSDDLDSDFWYATNNWVGFGFSQNAAGGWIGADLFPGRKYDARQGKTSAISLTDDLADTGYKLFLESGEISSEISIDLYGLIFPDLLGLDRGITLSGDRLYLCIQPEPLDKFADIKLGFPLSFTNAATFFRTYRRVKRYATPAPDGEVIFSEIVSSYHP